MNITVYIASAFSKDNQGGNKAGVVLYHDNLNNEQKKLIAKRMGFAETAFITNSELADFKFEYFTPFGEVPLCGHATIATFAILNHLNQLNKNAYTIETKSGVLDISLEDDIIFMEQNKPSFFEILSLEEMRDCFNIDCIDSSIPIQIGSTGLKDILVPIKSESLLNELVPNLEKITEISRKYDVVGCHLYAFNQERVICRNFAPLYEVDEEAATGSSNCVLAGFLHKNLNIKKKLYVFEQGHCLHSLSEILVKIVDKQEEITKIYVGGKAYYCNVICLKL